MREISCNYHRDSVVAVVLHWRRFWPNVRTWRRALSCDSPFQRPRTKISANRCAKPISLGVQQLMVSHVSAWFHDLPSQFPAKNSLSLSLQTVGASCWAHPTHPGTIPPDLCREWLPLRRSLRWRRPGEFGDALWHHGSGGLTATSSVRGDASPLSASVCGRWWTVCEGYPGDFISISGRSELVRTEQTEDNSLGRWGYNVLGSLTDCEWGLLPPSSMRIHQSKCEMKSKTCKKQSVC